jgi:hypothetical protein
MKLFLERLAGGSRSFRDLGMGETAALSLSKGMRRGQDSPVNKSLKKQAREPWNERKGFMVFAYVNKSLSYKDEIGWSGKILDHARLLAYHPFSHENSDLHLPHPA